jgi:hypothetical protein
MPAFGLEAGLRVFCGREKRFFSKNERISPEALPASTKLEKLL